EQNTTASRISTGNERCRPRLGGRPGYQLGFRANRSALEDDKVLGLRPEPVGILDLEVAVETRSVTRRDISVVEALPRYDRIIATRVRHSYLPHRSLVDSRKHRCVERTSRLQRAARVREEKVGATLADDDALVQEIVLATDDVEDLVMCRLQ